MPTSGQCEGLPSSLPHPPLPLPQTPIPKIIPNIHADSPVAKFRLQTIHPQRRGPLLVHQGKEDVGGHQSEVEGVF